MAIQKCGSIQAMALVLIWMVGCTRSASNAGDEKEHTTDTTRDENELGTEPECEDAGILPSSDDTGFRSIDFIQGWGPCENSNKCWVRMGVSYDGTLVLADGDGTEVFQITPEELNHVRNLAESPETQELIRAVACDGASGVGQTIIELKLKNGISMGHDQAGGCTAVKEPEEPVGKLFRYILEDLGDKYAPCLISYKYTIDERDFFVVTDERGIHFSLVTTRYCGTQVIAQPLVS